MSGLLFSNMRWAGQDYEVIIDEATKEVYVAGARAVAEAVGANQMSLSRFLASDSPEALPYKALTLSQAKHPKGYQVKAIPLDVIISFWAYLAGKGNNRAKALLEGAAKSNFRDTALAAANIHETGQQKEDALVEVDPLTCFTLKLNARKAFSFLPR